MPVTEPQVLKAAFIVGVVKYKRGEPSDPPCICCPGSPGHIYCRFVEFPKFDSEYPDHFGFGANEFIGTHVLYGDFEGKRVRLTVEVLEDECPTT
jgi:hypothetical protein